MPWSRRFNVLVFVLAALQTLATASAAPLAATRHQPSPDWRDQIIYFVVTDRFADGDARNNDQGAGEYDPSSNARYNGGDFAGLTARLDYIRGLGATAVWVTPPVANQWIEPASGSSGYHGYWAEHFKRVDKHLGTLADYRRLSHGLHSRGMFLVQDIVLNHTGDFFDYRGGWDPADPARFYTPNKLAKPAAPSQAPFNLNDPRIAAQRRAGIYHWTPPVRDYNDARQVRDFQMSGLDDLNTENPRVRRALRDSYGYWIREVGVDAFRVDTAFYVPPDLFTDFLYSRDKAAPGVMHVARASGRRAFHVFGEGFAIDKPFSSDKDAEIEGYMTDAKGRPLLPGMLNFPLYGTLGDVFARGHPSAELGWRIGAMLRTHARPHLMPSFVDNHDVDRFLAGASVPALKQALLAMMTLPGIPTVYYGTEQGFTDPRAAMFARGFASGGRDRYDTSAPLYRYIADIASLRRRHKVFSRGVPTVLADNAAAPGALAWRMDAQNTGEAPALVVFNSGDGDTLLDALDTGFAPGTRLEGLYGIEGRPADLVVGANGRVTLKLAARSGQVWQALPPRAPVVAASAQITLDTTPSTTVTGNFRVGGHASDASLLTLVVDGTLARAQRVQPEPDGHWQAEVDTADMVDPALRHTVVAWNEATHTVSERRAFTVQRQWQLLADAADPAGDDHGPNGRYRYPTDAGWGDNRQMDLRRIQAFGSGGALRLDLTTAKLTTLWNPPNGFDHVAFTVFIELPGAAAGSRVMPFQNGSLPPGMQWQRRLRVHGWSSALFDDAGASAFNEGTAIAGAAQIRVDAARNTVSLVLPASALGGMKSLSGVKIYVTTWDYDAGYRALARELQSHGLGGGDPETDPRVMDDSPVIVLP